MTTNESNGNPYKEKGTHTIRANREDSTINLRIIGLGQRYSLRRDINVLYLNWLGADAGMYEEFELGRNKIVVKGANFGDPEFSDFEDADNLMLLTLASRYHVLLNQKEQVSPVQQAELNDLEGLLKAA